MTASLPSNLAAVDELKRLAAKYGKTVPQFALRWTLHNTIVGTALVGFRTPAEVSEHLGAPLNGRSRHHSRPARRGDLAAGLARGLKRRKNRAHARKGRHRHRRRFGYGTRRRVAVRARGRRGRGCRSRRSRSRYG